MEGASTSPFFYAAIVWFLIAFILQTIALAQARRIRGEIGREAADYAERIYRNSKITAFLWRSELRTLPLLFSTPPEQIRRTIWPVRLMVGLSYLMVSAVFIPILLGNLAA